MAGSVESFVGHYASDWATGGREPAAGAGMAIEPFPPEALAVAEVLFADELAELCSTHAICKLLLRAGSTRSLLDPDGGQFCDHCHREWWGAPDHDWCGPRCGEPVEPTCSGCGGSHLPAWGFAVWRRELPTA